MNIVLIAAVDSARGLGKNGTIPWHSKEDLQHFKFVTQNTDDETDLDNPQTSTVPNAVIMGRVTWESLPEKHRPLSGRVNYVISRQEGSLADTGAIWLPSLEHCLRHASAYRCPNAFIIGGERVYKDALSKGYVDKCLITHIPGDFDCDRHLPNPKYFNFVHTRSYDLAPPSNTFVAEWNRNIV